MEQQTQGRELAQLQKEVGEWEASITVVPAPGAEPQASTGRLVARVVSGGRWLLTDFKNHTTGFEGHGVYGYNGASERYVGTWVDDMRTNIYVGEGEWDVPTATMTYVWKVVMPNGQVMTWKETTQHVSEMERLFRSVFPAPDGTDFEMMRIVYRRV